ncbi:MAG: nSTAND3 domain-containing NTPase, partial [Candidatus Methanospirareceae archaeon]
MAPAQSSNVSYELHTLGWKAFQDLCVTVASEILGQTVQSFLPSNDGGRDGAFRGIWSPQAEEGCSGSYTVQCKYSNSDRNLRFSDIDDELAKARRLAERDVCSNYVLMTNMGVSGVQDQRIQEAFLSVDGIESVLVFGKDWLTAKIRESARLRMLVPRVYGLGDLSQILDERAYAQSQEILSSLGDDLSKFVITGAYSKAAAALLDHGFVILLGEPAAGKTTIAASLAIGSLDLWGCSTLSIRDANEFVDHWNTYDPKQLFWVDDAFGATQYQRDLALEWSRVFPYMAAAIRQGARILFTSRDYIYRAARQDLKATAFPLINESQVVVDVQDLEQNEREQILYNHIKLGKQPKEFKSTIKPYLDEVSQHPRFMPEIARRLGDPIFTKSLSMTEPAIRRFVGEPIEFLCEIVTNLDPQSRAALGLLFMRGGRIESPIDLTDDEQAVIGQLGVSIPGAKKALLALESSLVYRLHMSGSVFWAFKHPTIADAYASVIADNPELLDVYLGYADIKKIVGEVTCGKVELDGVRLIVPENRYHEFMSRLSKIEHTSFLLGFLATRCSSAFLEYYILEHHELARSLERPMSFLYGSSEVQLLVRLHEYGILPEQWRKRFVADATELAVETPDVDCLAIPRIRALLNEDDIDSILGRVRSELLPSFSDVIW